MRDQRKSTEYDKENKALRNIIAHLPDHVYWLNLNNEFLGCNKQQAISLGLTSPNQIIGKTPYDFVSKGEAEIIIKNNNEVINTRKEHTYEETLFDRNHQKRFFLARKVPLLDENGKVIGLLGISTDITKNKKIEETHINSLMKMAEEVTGLRVKKNKHLEEHARIIRNYLEGIIDKMPGHVYWMNTNGVTLGCNNNMVKHAGLKSRDEIIGKTNYDLPWKDKADIYRKNDLEVIASGKEMEFEETGQLANGQWITALTRKVPIKDDKGKVIGILGISIDITERKKLQQEIQNAQVREKLQKAQIKAMQTIMKMAEEVTGLRVKKNKPLEEHARIIRNYLEGIIDKMPGHVYWLDTHGVILGCNDNMVKHAGLKSRDDIIGKTDYDLPWKDKADTYRENDREVIASGKEMEFEETAQYAGKRITALTRKVPIKDDKGKVIGILGISIDITERKKLQQEIQNAKVREKLQAVQLKAMQTIAASIAHELRTPLASISSATAIKSFLADLIKSHEMAREANLPVPFIRNSQIEAIKEGLGIVERETAFAQNTINRLLNNLHDLTNLQVNFTKLSMVNCVNKTLGRYPFNPPHQKKIIHWEPKQDFIFAGDFELIYQIFANLFSNAVYYIEKAGKGEIFLWIEQDSQYNHLHFKDTGQGISDDDLPHIFEQFYTKTDQGSGTGLAFCKMAMQSMGGDIDCQAQPGKYTEFILAFPPVKPV